MDQSDIGLKGVPDWVILKQLQHRWADHLTQSDHRAKDRVVLRDGTIIARIYQHEHGQQTGEWAWFGQWGEYDNSGVVAALDDALMLVRNKFMRADG